MYRLIFLFISILYGLEIDTSIEKNLAKNDINNRLILSKYYIDKNITKAEVFAKEVLEIDKNNKTAKSLLDKIILKKELKAKLGDKNIDKYYQDLFFNKKYNQIKQLSKYLLVINSNYPKIVTAKIYYWDGNYAKTKQILSLIKDKNNLDYIDIKANMNYYEGKYKKAIKD